jgi:hypothetical protein
MESRTISSSDKIWVGYSREELTTVWLGLVALRKSLESDLRKHLVKPMAAVAKRDVLMEQTEMYDDLAKVTRMLADVSQIVSDADLEGDDDEAEH